ncbi:hypothetical protein GP486_000344 [Trichoglossum hirsutum]|uniref:Uncharacterized protein n=1 Tax=Trichoglossum hirsutum TaxID=265104 RepID=A0A9P8LJ57_9PEZI|nr:hypothetical protein GP486_000344 [Trichoglossum hirsutum]
MKPSSSPALSAAVAFLAYSRLAVAVRWLEPIATPAGEWLGNMGISPMPTQPPDAGGIPKELLRRQDFPDNWCGFITGDVNDVLSCRPAYTCVYSGTAVGCCGAGLIATCTALFTSCANYNDPCGSACSLNNRVLKCSVSSAPYCATYTFASGKINYNCATERGILSSVAFLSDVLIPSGSKFSSGKGPVTIPSTASSFTVPGIFGGFSSSPTSGSVLPVTTSASSKKSGIGTGAIAGIVVGVIAIIGLIAGGLLAFLCLRGRNKGNSGTAAPAAAAAVAAQPPMQQQQPPPPPQGGYAPVPQSYPPQPQHPYYQQQQQQLPDGAISYYDNKAVGNPVDVPPQYQPNSPQPPNQEYAGFAGAAAQRDSVAKAPVMPEIAGTPVPGQQPQQGPSRVTSPVSTIGNPPAPAFGVGSTSGPVYEMPEGVHRQM